MHFTGAEIVAWVGAFVWPFFRIAALVGAAPLFGAGMVPMRIRVAVALALTLVIAPTIASPPQVELFSSEALLIVAQQVLIGLTMGFALQLVFAAFVLGGQLISFTMGLGLASVMDPVSGVTVPTLSQFYTLTVTLLFLAFNGHLVLIEVLADSFRTMPIAAQGLNGDGLWVLLLWAGHVFSGALLIALPAVAALLLANIGFGVLTRTAPQLNIFAVGFLVFILLGLVVVYLTVPGLATQLDVLMDSVFDLLRDITLGS